MRPVSVQVRRLMTKEEQEQFDQLWDIGKLLEQNQQFDYVHTIQDQLDRISEAAVGRMLRYDHRPDNKGMTAVDPEQAQVYVPEVKRIYLDHSATTPVRSEVRTAMMEVYEELFANPSSSHTNGRRVRSRLEDAREEVASLLGAKPQEVRFTGSGTEADNLAILGLAKSSDPVKPFLYTSTLEHHAVLDTSLYAHREYGWGLQFVGHDHYGRILVEHLREAIERTKPLRSKDSLALTSILYANNEIGTVQPISELADLCKQHGILFHTDAVQAIGRIPVDFSELGVDLLSVTAHKFYGPKGIGALLVREGTTIFPIMHGGGQEFKLRPSTENVAGIIGLQVALRLAQQELSSEQERIRILRDRMLKQIVTAIPDSKLNGHPKERLPNHLHISFKAVDASLLLSRLDILGVEVSAGSACDANGTRISHVLEGIGLEPEWAKGSIRITLGKDTTEQDTYLAGKKIIQAVTELGS